MCDHELSLSAPCTIATGFQIFNKPEPIGTPGSPADAAPLMVQCTPLRHHQSVFSFALSALSYRSAEENQCGYRLEGFNKDWHQVGKKRMQRTPI